MSLQRHPESNRRSASQNGVFMHSLSIPCIIMSSINLYVGLYYFSFYLKRPQIREHLPFAFLCLSVGFYDIFSVGLYNSLSISDGIIWQRLQLDTVAAISVFLIWFTGVYTKQKNNRIIPLLIAWFIIILIASFFTSPKYSLSTVTPSIKEIYSLYLPNITYYESAVGIIYQVEIISAIITYIYLCYLFISYYRKTGFKLLLLIISCQIIYLIGVVNDSLVAMRFYSSIYISEYSFFFIILSMAYVLLDTFVDLHSAYEELNADLEKKVYERTCAIIEAQAQVKRLEGIIPICMYCKKIRDDKKSWLQLEQYISEHSEAMFSHGVCPECSKKLL